MTMEDNKFMFTRSNFMQFLPVRKKNISAQIKQPAPLQRSSSYWQPLRLQGFRPPLSHLGEWPAQLTASTYYYTELIMSSPAVAVTITSTQLIYSSTHEGMASLRW